MATLTNATSEPPDSTCRELVHVWHRPVKLGDHCICGALVADAVTVALYEFREGA